MMHTIRTTLATALDGIARALDWLPIGARKLAGLLRGGGQGEEQK